jgi:glycosyltransferase involved in cell wall biosynthesis
MSTEPLISVVMPAHNGARFLGAAMESVVAQRYGNLEVLLVDDGSEDGLGEKVKECPGFVKYFRQEQRGPAAARNKGIREAAGSTIGFLDIDDLWTEGHLRRLMDALDAQPEAGIAQGTMRQFRMTAEGKYRVTEPYRMPYLGSCLFRRSVFTQCGMFDEQLMYGEDQDLFYRCWESDVVKVNVTEVSLLYRRHATNMTRGHNEAAHVRTMKKRIERIRRGMTEPAAARRYRFQDYIGDREQVSGLSSMEVSECDLRSA